ncbi:MAG: 3',5'-cyclic-nucleotide phosphodiesterase [Gemmatimonadales bacterium]|nr:MAG: 3',5'-cyclic-nucleotide phosphodiesterase [Gemmatimonadales bacterium]
MERGRAGEGPLLMLRIVHGSDIHFGRPHDPAMARAFLEATLERSPDLLVLSGDFTQRAKVAEFREARSWLDGLPRDLPIVVTPGNHDVPLWRVAERLLSPFRNYRRFIHPELDRVTRVPGATVVSLNSAAPRRAITNGRLGSRQLEFARRAFDASPPEDVRILVAHHHLAPAPDYQGDRPLPRARQILEALESMGVQLVLGGHLHRAYIGNSLDVHPGADRNRGIVIVQSGTTTSRRGRAREQEKNSFNEIRVEGARIEVEHLMHFREDGGFRPFSHHVFPRPPFSWLGQDGTAAPGGGKVA